MSEGVYFNISWWLATMLVTCPCCLLVLKWEVTVSDVACDNLHLPGDKGAKLSSNHLFLAPELSNYGYVSHFVF